MADYWDAIAAAVRVGYGITVSSIIQMKTVFGVLAEDGQRFIWKFVRANDTEYRLAALHAVGARVAEAGISVASPIPNWDGRFITHLETGEGGYLQPWMTGRHVRLGDKQERLMVIATIAQFHRWAMVASPVVTLDSPGGVLPVRLKRKRAILGHALQLAENRFFVQSQMRNALLSMADEAVEYASFLEPELPRHLRFCHRDLAPHNLLWLNDGRVALIDFDRAGWDDPLLDLLQLFNHTLFLNEHHAVAISDFVDVYTRNQRLTEQRIVFFKKIAGFPEHLTRALVEWVKAGYPENQKVRVEWALAKERFRQELLLGTQRRVNM